MTVSIKNNLQLGLQFFCAALFIVFFAVYVVTSTVPVIENELAVTAETEQNILLGEGAQEEIEEQLNKLNVRRTILQEKTTVYMLSVGVILALRSCKEQCKDHFNGLHAFRGSDPCTAPCRNGVHVSDKAPHHVIPDGALLSAAHREFLSVPVSDELLLADSYVYGDRCGTDRFPCRTESSCHSVLVVLQSGFRDLGRSAD